jgi:hypothetical protein
MGKGQAGDEEGNIFSRAVKSGVTCCTNWTLGQWLKLISALVVFWAFMVGWMSIHIYVMTDMLPKFEGDYLVNRLDIGEKNTDKFTVDTLLLANKWGKNSESETSPDFELSPEPWRFDQDWYGACLDVREESCNFDDDVLSRDNKRANAQDDNWRALMTSRNIHCKGYNGDCKGDQQIRLGNQYRLKQLGVDTPTEDRPDNGDVTVVCGLNQVSKLFKPNLEGTPFASDGGVLQFANGDDVDPNPTPIDAEAEKIAMAYLEHYNVQITRSFSKVGNQRGDPLPYERDANHSRIVEAENTVEITSADWKKQFSVVFKAGTWLPHIEQFTITLVPKDAARSTADDKFNVYMTCGVVMKEELIKDGGNCLKEFKRAKKDKRTDDEDDKRTCAEFPYRFDGNDDPMFWKVFGISRVQFKYTFDYTEEA